MPDPSDLDARFRTLVQSPLRAGILRYLNSRTSEAFDVESLMQTFGRLKLDVDDAFVEASRLPPDMRENVGDLVRMYRRQATEKK